MPNIISDMSSGYSWGTGATITYTLDDAFYTSLTRTNLNSQISAMVVGSIADGPSVWVQANTDNRCLSRQLRCH